MKKNKKCIDMIYRIIIIAICFVKYIILCTRSFYVNLDTMFDSHLQVKQAAYILSGNWLGTYDKFAMCKVPGFPLFLAAINLLHISYPFAVLIIEVFAVSYLIFAFSPIIKNKWYRLLMFCFVLFGPFDWEYCYPYRNMLSPWITLVIIASFAGIWICVCESVKNKSELSLKKIIVFSICGFFSTGYIWILREDSMWILPYICVACLIIAIQTIRLKENAKIKALIIFLSLSSFMGIAIISATISCINYKYYGIYATNDRMDTYEAKVLGDLILIDDGTPLDQDVWVSDGTLELAKKVSPTFASLDLSPFSGWPKIGDYSIWALRDSVTNSGYYVDAKSTNDLYKKIDSELTDAFKNGKLKKKNGIQLSDTSGIFTYSEMIGVVKVSVRTFYNHINYKFIPLPQKAFNDNLVSETDESDLNLYKDILKIDFHKAYDETTLIGKNPGYLARNEFVYKQKENNSNIIGIINKIYQKTGMFLFVLVFIQLVVYLKRKDFKLFIVLSGILATAFTNSYLVCLWAIPRYVMAEDPIYYEYTYVEYLLIAVVEIICTYSFLREIIVFVRKIKKRKDEPVAQGEY